MLKELLQIYLNFSDESLFREAIATDGFYTAAVFSKIFKIAQRKQMLSDADLGRLKAFTDTLGELASAAKQQDAMEEDMPEEFFDPIMCTVMEDPVLLPSGNRMDRATILQHLLNDKNDPFNRQPLSPEDLVPDVALKARIVAWQAAHGK